jgi:glycosyltransferase involved in cell wall biosynthesis
MKISVISRWHNEEFLAPFFLGHYAWTDEIIVMLDKSTTDRSAEVIARYPNARFEYYDHGGKLNDRILASMMSDLAASLKSDWVIYVDADELAFPVNPHYSSREILLGANGNLIECWFRWVYRHRQDADLNPLRPALWQRRHGGRYTLAPGCGDRFMKPCIVRPAAGIRWGVGQHDYEPNPKILVSAVQFAGAHWQMADVEMAVERSLPRTNTERLSAENIRNGWGVRPWTEKQIRTECLAHLDDPKVI